MKTKRLKKKTFVANAHGTVFRLRHKAILKDDDGNSHIAIITFIGSEGLVELHYLADTRNRIKRITRHVNTLLPARPITQP